MFSSHTSASSATQGRAANVVLWVLQGLLAFFFAFAGVNKLLGLQQEMVDNFARLGPLWFRYFVGVLELVGAAALVTPRLAGLGALWLAGVMVGAVLTHLLFQPPAYMATFPAVLCALFLVIAWGRRRQTLSVLADLRG